MDYWLMAAAMICGRIVVIAGALALGAFIGGLDLTVGQAVGAGLAIALTHAALTAEITLRR
jgi:hypothetical protein